ncbi:hypothetical protein BKI52_36535 [marine bacterium AO1-C]|nr:hypothetical protein BKI52_36535 [marine bacterium AO1-C]
MKKITMLMGLLALVGVVQAQLITTKSVIEKCPEMEIGKVYTGKDVRAAKKNFPKGVYIAGYGTEKNYPFAKITGKKVTVLLTFEDKYKGEIVYMHAYTYRRKTNQLEQSQSYIYNDGKANRATTYKSTIKLTEDKELIIDSKENGKQKIGKYKLGKKRLSFVEWIKD